MVRNIEKDCHWTINNSKYYDEYLKKCHKVKRRFFIQKEISRVLGEATIGATIQIIQYFKPKCWIIENPQTSKTWQYQKNHWDFIGKENLTYYSSYDKSFSAKPTIFKANIKLNLISKKIKGANEHMAKGNYAKRSSIPLGLIKNIIESIKAGGKIN